MSMLTVANLLLIFAIVAFFSHAYFRNTVDFSYYRTLRGVPAANRVMKVIYINSFFLFIVAVAGFLTSVVFSSFHLETAARDEAVLGLAIVLALLALRLITMPEIGRWRMRTE